VPDELSPKDVAAMLERGEIQLIDVRRDDEWEAGRIPGARHIELMELSDQAGTIEHDMPVVFYCHVGSRSGMAAEAFLASGFDAHNMAGGIEAWHEQGLPLEPADGRVI
jgi:rhodanese-related sulfurtransferase